MACRKRKRHITGRIHGRRSSGSRDWRKKMKRGRRNKSIRRKKSSKGMMRKTRREKRSSEGKMNRSRKRRGRRVGFEVRVTLP